MSELKARPRDPRRKPHQLRRAGIVPMALVERDNTTLRIETEEALLREATRSADALGRLNLRLSDEDRPRKVMVKQVDSDPSRGILIHVTLVEVGEDDEVRVDVPVRLVGHNEAADGKGVTLTLVQDHLKLKGRMGDLPSEVTLDVTELGVGQHIEAHQVPLPTGVQLLTTADSTVVSLALVTEASAALPEDAASADAA